MKKNQSRIDIATKAKNIDTIYIDNIELNYREIQDRKLSLLSMPQRMTVNLSTRCNLSCRMCNVHKTTWEISTKTIKEVVALFPYLTDIAWEGGEVFLFGPFKKMLQQAAKYQKLVHQITTNGHLIDETWIEIFNKINLNLCISIDGVTKQTYEYIRKGSKFKQLLDVLNLLAVNKKSNDKLLFLSLVVTVMKSNYRELELFVDFAKKYGFDKLFLQPIGGDIDPNENIFSHNDKEALMFIERIKPKMKRQSEKYGLEFYEWLPTKADPTEVIAQPKQAKPSCETDRLFCLAPWQQLFIAWEGAVYPHCLCRHSSQHQEPAEHRQVGNTFQNSLMDIWNGEQMRLFRKKIVDGCFEQLCCDSCRVGSASDNLRSFRKSVSTQKLK